jgi:excisionase family DNA binding protein
MAPDKEYDSPLMNVAQCANYLQVHRSTIYRLVKRGNIPAFRVGADWRFKKTDVDSWLIRLSRGEVKAST